MVDLIIHNIGRGLAYNLKLELDGDIDITTNKKLSELTIIKKGIKFLAPDQKIQFFLTSFYLIKKENPDLQLSVTVTYEDSLKKSYEETFTLDFPMWRGILMARDRTPIQRINSTLEEIKNALNSYFARQNRPTSLRQ